MDKKAIRKHWKNAIELRPNEKYPTLFDVILILRNKEWSLFRMCSDASAVALKKELAADLANAEINRC